jgi:hypothetical protein
LWSLQALGLDDGWRQLAQVVTVCEVRGDFEVAKDDETFRFPFELTRFLAVDHVERADVSRLDAVLQLHGLADAWDDDIAFAALTEGWCEWHWRYSEKRRANVWNFANLPHDILFPSWIFAIDRCRQRAMGRSALGTHELVDYGRRFISAVRAEAIAPPPVLVAAIKKYNELFWTADWEMVDYWEKFVARG